MIQRISLPEWHRMAQEGEAPPLRILIYGSSMFPLVRKKKDYVTIQPLSAPPERGDIVLFSDPKRERYVLHRVWRTEDERVLTWGDNCSWADGWIPLENVWGKATLIERGKRRIYPSPGAGLWLGRVWHALGGGYRALRRLKRNLRKYRRQT